MSNASQASSALSIVPEVLCWNLKQATRRQLGSRGVYTVKRNGGWSPIIAQPQSPRGPCPAHPDALLCPKIRVLEPQPPKSLLTLPTPAVWSHAGSGYTLARRWRPCVHFPLLFQDDVSQPGLTNPAGKGRSGGGDFTGSCEAAGSEALRDLHPPRVTIQGGARLGWRAGGPCPWGLTMPQSGRPGRVHVWGGWERGGTSLLYIFSKVWF